MTSILIVAGTRPEIIKVAPVFLKARDRRNSDVSIRLCLTGQHKTMADEALSIFEIQPEASLEIMRPDQTLNDIAESVFQRLPEVLDRFSPDIMMVQGDTTTAAMSSLCAFNRRIPVAHIEAGLRSFNLDAPYPEECNRRVIGAMARYNLSPTTRAAENLRREGVPEERIYLTGNTIVDAIHFIRRKFDLDGLDTVLPGLQKPFVLITAHRRESFGQGFQHICEAIRALAVGFPSTEFVYPVHLNPNVQKPVHALLGTLKNVRLIPPVPYLPLLTLLNNCELVLTDSGGIQEEAPSFGKYCIVMRDVTERMESVDLGISELVGTDTRKIVSAVSTHLGRTGEVSGTANPYGDGHASERILDILSGRRSTVHPYVQATSR
ncbi:MAG: UDP-N-acetylglucosamine 2-epimerase (non-hydrolyzing) [Ignavibacteria bacterium]|nr:UDP-N-acetylglucosamine 2-epimerase (non-hydrolyzing) [Ignavibacteria bacterium]